MTWISERIVSFLETLVDRKIEERFREDGIRRSYNGNITKVDKSSDPYQQRCDVDVGFTTLEGVINKTGELLISGDSVIILERYGSNFTDCFVMSKLNTFIEEIVEEDTTTEEEEQWFPYEDEGHFWVAGNIFADTSSFIMTNWFEVLPGLTNTSEQWLSNVQIRIDYLFQNPAWSTILQNVGPGDNDEDIRYDTSTTGYPGGYASYCILRQDRLIPQQDIIEQGIYTPKNSIERISVHQNWTNFTGTTTSGAYTNTSVAGYISDQNPTLRQQVNSASTPMTINLTGDSPTETIDGVDYNVFPLFQVIVRFTRGLDQSVTGTQFRVRQILNTYNNANSAFLLYPAEDPARAYIN